MEEKTLKENKIVNLSCLCNPLSQKLEVCVSFEELMAKDFTKPLKIIFRGQNTNIYSFKVLNFTYIFWKEFGILYQDSQFEKIKPTKDVIISPDQDTCIFLLFLKNFINQDVRLKDKGFFNKVSLVVLEIELNLTI